MEYTVQKLGRIAGVSPRTLRFYHEIGLLKPGRQSDAGYRLYGPPQVERLQQILFYRELGFSLEEIKDLMDAPDFDGAGALRAHRARLYERRAQLDKLIENVERTLQASEGRIPMSDEQRFEGFKRALVEENERTYGQEVRSQYGEDVVNQSNQKVLDMTPEQHAELEALSAKLKETLRLACEQGDPAGELAQQAADLHRQWLLFFWPKNTYSPETHLNLAQMYVDDDRFRAYYDADRPGTAAFLRDAIAVYTRG